MNKQYVCPISYAQFLRERNEFRKSGTRSGSDFNLYETPINTYFKILFYFHNGDEDNIDANSGGLLAPTWDYINNDNYYAYNSAWSYLKMNGEEQRAEKLKNFINLLSNINSEAPWTFTSLSGLDEAINRSAVHDVDFKISDERKKITIKCMPDSYDTRIGTLLDLYRSIVWSWKTKREIVPANLRKFDMGIYIYSDIVHNMHLPNSQKSSVLDSSNLNSTSFKYIEFHNCEIDYNSSKSGYGELNNSDGNVWEYSIDIYYDDVYENRYNEFLMRKIGDMIIYDTNMAVKSELQNDVQGKIEEIEKRTNLYYNESITGQILDELKGAAKSIISNKIHNAILGNLYTASLPTISSQLKGAAKGHVFSTINAISDYSNGVGYKPNSINGDLGNLFKSKMKNI